MFDIITIGDSMIDTFLFIHDVKIQRINGQLKALINWGDKLPVDKLYRSVAGNSANNAVGSARLGLRTAYYTIIAHDSGGREIVHKLRKEGVHTDYIVTDNKHGTNSSVILSYKGERTIFVYHESHNYKLPRFAASKWVYLTSMKDGFSQIHSPLVRYLKAYKVKLGFNPGTYQLRAGPAANKAILKVTDMISVNKEEAQSWVGHTEDIHELCRRLAKLGPKIVVLTDGRKGAYSYSGQGYYYIPEFPGPRLEATGAGDSFTTAYLAALFYGKPPAEALRWAPVNAGSVVQQVGPQAGLLTKREIELRLAKMKRFQPIAITNEATRRQAARLAARYQG
jgi:sugar/nucleoside kinase (ribokinase family)